MPSLTIADTASRTKAMAEPRRKRNWIKTAVPKANRGAFRAKAARAGKSTSAFARLHDTDSGKLGKEARLAETLIGMSHNRKRRSLYDKD